MWKEKTNHGRVVYDRKKHEFTIRDMERIWRTLGEKRRDRTENQEFMDLLERLLLSMLRWLIDNPDFAFSGGVLLSIAMVIDNAIDFCSGDKSKRPDYGTGGGGASGPF